MRVRIRDYGPRDAAAAYAVFRRAVHEGAARHYSEAERAAWAPDPDPPADWAPRLARHLSWVALHRRRLVGFATLGRDGHLDLFYVTPEAMGRGVADKLYVRVEAAAKARGLAVLDTVASRLSRSFLARRGWRVAARQSAIRGGVALTTYRMEKVLTQGHDFSPF